MPGCQVISIENSESSQATPKITQKEAKTTKTPNKKNKLRSPWRPDKGWRILPLTRFQLVQQLNASSPFSTKYFPSQLLQKDPTRACSCHLPRDNYYMNASGIKFNQEIQ